MESDILVDGERLKTLVGTDRTFEKNGDAVIWWVNKPERDAYKFLVIHGRLVIGAIGSHDALYAAWTLRDEPDSPNLRGRVEAIARQQWDSRNWVVTGAGKIGVDGQVTGWKSECFRVETPESMRSGIEQEVMRLFRSGALAPR